MNSSAFYNQLHNIDPAPPPPLPLTPPSTPRLTAAQQMQLQQLQDDYLTQSLVFHSSNKGHHHHHHHRKTRREDPDQDKAMFDPNLSYPPMSQLIRQSHAGAGGGRPAPGGHHAAFAQSQQHQSHGPQSFTAGMPLGMSAASGPPSISGPPSLTGPAGHRSHRNAAELYDMESSFGSSSTASVASSSYGPPLDYSFRNISSLGHLEKPHPRQSLRKQRRSPSGRYNSNVIRLANNNLVDTQGLYKMALDVVEFPEDIAWLDLSFNDITTISDDILEFPALKMIYLHGNKIGHFSDLKRLQMLPNLYSLTLHGNPIENYPNYRSSVICMFPSLKSLDFAKVTEDEKDSAKLQIIVTKNGKKKKNKEANSSPIKKFSL